MTDEEYKAWCDQRVAAEYARLADKFPSDTPGPTDRERFLLELIAELSMRLGSLERRS